MLRRLVVVAAALAALLSIAFAIIWFVPGVQDALVKRGMVQALAKANALPFLQDKSLHILLRWNRLTPIASSMGTAWRW
jgi:hypothetical protein